MKIELDPLKDNPVKRNHPAASEKLFTIEWLGEANEDFLNGDITRAYTDKFGTTYGESLRGSWLPVGEEGENWSWVRYNPKKGCRTGAKRNPVGRGDWFVLFEDAKGVISYYAGDSDRGVRLTLRDDEARHLELRRATQLAKKLNALYAKTHKDGADFYVVAASTIKANPRDPRRSGKTPRGEEYFETGTGRRLVISTRKREEVEGDLGTSIMSDTVSSDVWNALREGGGKSDMPISAATRATAMKMQARRASVTMKKNPVYRSKEPDIGEIRLRNAASGVPYEQSLSLDYVDEDEDQEEDYDALSESGLRELLRYRDPNGYATLGDEGPVNRGTLIEALTYLDDLELGKQNPAAKNKGIKVTKVKSGVWEWTFTAKGEKFGGYGRTKADAMNDAKLTLMRG
jgi:hypothetical protein